MQGSEAAGEITGFNFSSKASRARDEPHHDVCHGELLTQPAQIALQHDEGTGSLAHLGLFSRAESSRAGQRENGAGVPRLGFPGLCYDGEGLCVGGLGDAPPAPHLLHLALPKPTSTHQAARVLQPSVQADSGFVPVTMHLPCDTPSLLFTSSCWGIASARLGRAMPAHKPCPCQHVHTQPFHRAQPFPHTSELYSGKLSPKAGLCLALGMTMNDI